MYARIILSLRFSGVTLVKKSTKKIKEKFEHKLIAQHVLLSEEDKQKVLAKYNATESNFPRIHATDPALYGLEVNLGDMILIKRKDISADYDYYRIVVKG